MPVTVAATLVPLGSSAPVILPPPFKITLALEPATIFCASTLPSVMNLLPLPSTLILVVCNVPPLILITPPSAASTPSSPTVYVALPSLLFKLITAPFPEAKIAVSAFTLESLTVITPPSKAPRLESIFTLLSSMVAPSAPISVLYNGLFALS